MMRGRKPVVATAGAAFGGAKSGTYPEGHAGFRIEVGDVDDNCVMDLAGDAAVPAGETIVPRALSAAEADKVFEGVDAIAVQEGDEKAFAMRPKTKPPPKTGDIVEHSFPPAEDMAPPEAADAGDDGGAELTVLRYSPEGDVPIASHLSVTFSHAMVPLSTVAQLADTESPVELQPQPAGRWRWVGTQTILFEPEHRFPCATEYKAVIAKATKSACGRALASSVSFSFTTSKLAIASSSPHGTVPHTPLFALAFNQKVEAADVLPLVRVRARGTSAEMAVEAASDEELGGDSSEARMAKGVLTSATPGTAVAFKLAGEQRLEYGQEHEIVLHVNAPSAEGPLRTDTEQTVGGFRAYGRFEFSKGQPHHGPEWTPHEHIRLQFTNVIERSTVTDETVHAEPPIPAMRVRAEGSMLVVSGRTVGNTDYKLTMRAGAMRDVFGQELAEEAVKEIKVGRARPLLQAFRQGTYIADPMLDRSKLAYPVVVVNHDKVKVSVRRVGRKDMLAGTNRSQNALVAGKEVYSHTLDTGCAPDVPKRIDLSLTEAMNEEYLGHALVDVEELKPEHGHPVRLTAWVQSTRLAVDVLSASCDTGVYVYVSELVDGSPVQGATVEVVEAMSRSAAEKVAARGESDEHGMCHLRVPARHTYRAVATKGNDWTFAPRNFAVQQPQGDQVLWHVFDDRQLYKPGEEVHVKGWMRLLARGLYNKATEPLAGQAVEYSVMVGRDTTAKGTVETNALGGFDVAFTLPKEAQLGHARVSFKVAGKHAKAPGAHHVHSFQVQEFRTPEFECSASVRSPAVVTDGHSACVEVSASYFAGGALESASVEWGVTSAASKYTPPGRADFVFGKESPVHFWQRWGGGRGTTEHLSVRQVHEGSLDADGKHRVAVRGVGQDATPSAVTITAEAAVVDVNRQRQASSASFIIHPSELYVGLCTAKGVPKSGKALEASVLVCDVDGRARPGQAVHVELARIESKYENYEWVETRHVVKEVTFASGEDAAPLADFVPQRGGRHELTARVADERGRANIALVSLWVAGPMGLGGRRSGGPQDGEIVMLPDKSEYAVGDEAHVTLQPPFAPCELTVAWYANDITEVRRVHVSEEDGFHVESFAITEQCVPGVHLRVCAVGKTARELQGWEGEPTDKPAFSTGVVSLNVSQLSRTLAVDVAPESESVEPGASTAVNVCVVDASGAPVQGAEVAVVVVDEAVLSLTGYSVKSPLSSFVMPHRSVNPQHMTSRMDVYLLDWSNIHIQGAPLELLDAEMMMDDCRGGFGGGPIMFRSRAAPQAMMACNAEKSLAAAAPRKRMLKKNAPGGQADGGSDDGAAQAVKVRSNFNPLALFKPDAVSGTDGRVRVEVVMPDNLTRYRIWALAVHSTDRFGMGESGVTARLPLMVRPSFPRFLNFGDRALGTVVVQNQGLPGGADGAEVRIALRATNAELDDAARAFSAVVPAGRRCEFQFPVRPHLPGRARFQAVVRGGGSADAAVIDLPTWTPAVSEAFATYGELDANGAQVQRLQRPMDVIPYFGGVDVSVCSTALAALTDSFLYLWNYQHDCAEQLASKGLAVVALRDVLTAFDVAGAPSAAEMTAYVNTTSRRLAALQRSDGSWGWWPSSVESSIFSTVHVTHFLARAHEKAADGYEVRDETLDRATRYLSSGIDALMQKYSENTRFSLRAMAYFVCWLAGKNYDEKQVEKLWVDSANGDKMTMESMAYVLMCVGEKHAIGARIVKHLKNRVSETAETATFVTRYSDANEGTLLLLHSDRRTDAVVLQALMRADPFGPLNTKVVKGLLAHRSRGRWGNTQENSQCLLALDAYFQAIEKNEPDYTARAWVGNAFVGEHTFKGRSVDTQRYHVPMQEVLEACSGADTLPLTVQREGVDGSGRLYYRVGLSYCRKDLSAPPCEAGFSVQRVYEAVDKPDDVRRDDDGVWHVRAGARLRVKLTMSTASRRYHVALVDKLPAGLEALNPALKTTGSLPSDEDESGRGSRRRGLWSCWRRTWFEHQNLRDERAEAFASLVYAGVHTYSYMANATARGEFVVPPANAEEMYSPEVFGRSSYEKLVVE